MDDTSPSKQDQNANANILIKLVKIYYMKG